MTAISLKFILLIAAIGLLSFKVNAQDDMKKPEPIKSETLQMLMGTWKADPYDMMGSKWSETATHSMKLNGQFMFIDITGSDDKNTSYTGTVIIQPDKNGNFTGWSFDDWGQVTTYTGKATGNKITITGTGTMGTETRDIEINGNTMVHKVTWTMKDKDGKDMTMNQTITYHKE